MPDSVEGVTNCDFSDLVGGHNEWKANLGTVLDRLGLGKEALMEVEEAVQADAVTPEVDPE